MAKEHKTVSVDFDGVIHSYTSGWQGPLTIGDPPVDGALEALRRYIEEGWRVVISSVRAETNLARREIQNWMVRNGLGREYVNQILITPMKERANVYIDDRGFRFEGSFPTPNELDALSSTWGGRPKETPRRRKKSAERDEGSD